MREDAIFFEAPVSSALTNSRVWGVGALVRAIGDALQARFNPVSVEGEITGFSRAASGHCYFSLKDEAGQIRCAMFRRAAQLCDFSPREGDRVELRGRLDVYEPRGDLQLIVESMQRSGQGALFEKFLRLKTQLQAEGLFDEARKRPIAPVPRGIGLVTSAQAAAFADVAAALQRRSPHVPVWFAPASVQGASAPQELCEALQKLYRLAQIPRAKNADSSLEKPMQKAPIDVILIVRGGGSIEDLWAFNDETLARTIAQSPIPVISGVGHETDFTICDFVADLRAPTPTAAAELCATERSVLLNVTDAMHDRLQAAWQNYADEQEQNLDHLAAQLGKPSELTHQAHLQLQNFEFKLKNSMLLKKKLLAHDLYGLEAQWVHKKQHFFDQNLLRLTHLSQKLDLLSPARVLERGYALLQSEKGVVTDPAQVRAGQLLKAQLAKGEIELTVK